MLQLEQTVNELQLANRRLNQENVKYRQIFDAAGLSHSNHSDRDNFELLGVQHWHQKSRSNEGDWHANGDGCGHSAIGTLPAFQPYLGQNPNMESQTCAIEGTDNSSFAHFTKYGSNMPMRKRSMNIPTDPHLSSNAYPSSSPLKLPEKRRKSCPSYPTSCMSNEFQQWPNPCSSSMSESTSSIAKIDFPPHSSTFSSQRRSSLHSLPQSPVQTFHESMQEPLTLNGNLSLPSINSVLGCNSSANGSQFLTNTSERSRSFNFVDGGNIPAQWENTESFNCKEYTSLTDCSHQGTRRLGSTPECFETYQPPTADFASVKQTPTSTGRILRHGHPGYDEIKTFDDIFEWISEEY